MTAAHDSENVLQFWFGTLDENGHATPATAKRWFGKSVHFDQEIRDRFGAVHAAVAAGDCDAWLETPRGRLAYILVLDQLSRNMFRDSKNMFSYDARALGAAEDGIARGDDQKLAVAERAFFYMPLMHSEDLNVQEKSVTLFEKVGQEQTKYAVMHRDIIRRFGRFPHRNLILDRTSTQEELEFLNEPNAAF